MSRYVPIARHPRDPENPVESFGEAVRRTKVPQAALRLLIQRVGLKPQFTEGRRPFYRVADMDKLADSYRRFPPTPGRPPKSNPLPNADGTVTELTDDLVLARRRPIPRWMGGAGGPPPPPRRRGS